MNAVSCTNVVRQEDICKTFYKSDAWLSAGCDELDAVGCTPFGGELTLEVEVISGDISRFKSRDVSALFRPTFKFGTEAERGWRRLGRIFVCQWGSILVCKLQKKVAGFILVSKAMQP